MNPYEINRRTPNIEVTSPTEQDYFAEKLGYNPWEMQREIAERKAAEQEYDAMIKAKMITKKQKEAALKRGGTPAEALSEDPRFLDKVFPRK